MLGELESKVLNVVWEMGAATVREVCERLSRPRPLAYTTVMTTMDRLHEKGFLVREKRGRGYVYAPRVTRQEFGRTQVRKWLHHLVRTLGAPAMSYLVEAIREVESTRLDELAEMIERERRKAK